MYYFQAVVIASDSFFGSSRTQRMKWTRYQFISVLNLLEHFVLVSDLFLVLGILAQFKNVSNFEFVACSYNFLLQFFGKRRRGLCKGSGRAQAGQEGVEDLGEVGGIVAGSCMTCTTTYYLCTFDLFFESVGVIWFDNFIL